VKNVLLKIGCLIVAILVWIQVAATTMVETDVSMPLEVVGLADSLTTAGSNVPETGRARIRAPKLEVMANQYFGYSLGSIAIDLTNKQPGPALVHQLNEADVRTEAEVVGLLPPVRFPLRIDVHAQRRVPVHASVRGALPADRVLTGPIGVRPESVLVAGPRRYFAGLDSLVTEVLDLSSLQRSVTREVPLVPPPPPLSLEQDRVTLSVPVARLDERVLANVPVLVVADTDMGEPGVSPPVCDVLVRGPADSVAAMRPDRLLVTVPVAGLEPGVHQVVGQVQHPPWVTSIQLTPAQFMVLVGDAPEPPRPEGPR